MVVNPLTKVTTKYVFLLNMCFRLIVGVWNFVGFDMFFLYLIDIVIIHIICNNEVINFNSCFDVIDIA